MKLKSILIVFLFCTSICFSNSKNSHEGIKENHSIESAGVCTINVYTELDNGTVVEGKVTITSDEMNRLKCWAIKFYGLFTSDY